MSSSHPMPVEMMYYLRLGLELLFFERTSLSNNFVLIKKIDN